MIPQKNKQNDELTHRRRGGAFDMIARVIRKIQVLDFSNGVIAKNRVGGNFEGATPSASVFEMFHTKEASPGKYNLMFFGRGGNTTEPASKNTNYLELSAGGRSDETSTVANGRVLMTVSEDGDPKLSFMGILNTRNSPLFSPNNGAGVASIMSGEGQGGSIMTYIDGTTGSINYALIVDQSGIQGTDAYQDISDERAKKDVAELSYGLKEILKLRPVSYKKKEGPDKTNLGLIAQEVKEIVPEVVGGSEETQYSIAYSSLVPVLINAVKELSEKVKKLENK